MSQLLKLATKPYGYLKIQDWAKEDRPREKLVNKGSHALSNAELLGILIGSGTQHMGAVDLAQHILKECDHDLNVLAKQSVESLQRFKGIGQAKAVTIVSAVELLNRRENYLHIVKPKIDASVRAYKLMIPLLIGKVTEEFWIILLNRNNRVLKKCQISKGGLAKTIVDPKSVFKAALAHDAAGIILVHNHPSGCPRPSKSDIKVTTNLVDGAKVLDLDILDHIVFTDNEYFSFADEGLIL